jgi:hypothetical protein
MDTRVRGLCWVAGSSTGWLETDTLTGQMVLSVEINFTE